jgi:hypothetical protein
MFLQADFNEPPNQFSPEIKKTSVWVGLYPVRIYVLKP